MDKYAQWTSGKVEEKAIVVFDSMWHSTERMANAIVQGFIDKNIPVKFYDLKEDMILTGTVRNITDFGVFVDVGVKHDGLVHISEMSDKFVKKPSDIVSIGDIVKVRVIGIDTEKQKVKLSMKNVG